MANLPETFFLLTRYPHNILQRGDTPRDAVVGLGAAILHVIDERTRDPMYPSNLLDLTPLAEGATIFFDGPFVLQPPRQAGSISVVGSVFVEANMKQGTIKG